MTLPTCQKQDPQSKQSGFNSSRWWQSPFFYIYLTLTGNSLKPFSAKELQKLSFLKEERKREEGEERGVGSERGCMEKQPEFWRWKGSAFPFPLSQESFQGLQLPLTTIVIVTFQKHFSTKSSVWSLFSFLPLLWGQVEEAKGCSFKMV